MNRSCFAAAWVALVSPSALAQTPSDLMPRTSDPQSGAGASRPYYIPGRTPAQQAGLAPDKTPSATVTPPLDPFSARGTGTAILKDDSPSAATADSPSSGDTSVHLIAPGETLSAIAERYFGSSAAWPRLWSLNPSITNPHWIYPGDTIRVAPASHDAPPPPRPRPVVDGEPIQQLQTPEVRRASTFASNTGFVEPAELAGAAMIVGSHQEKLLLADLDDVYLDPVEGKKLALGQRYTVFREKQVVVHPVTGEKMGSIVEFLGEIDLVKAGSDLHATGVLNHTVDAIERGDRALPLQRRYEVLAPVPADRNLDGLVVAAILPAVLLGNEMVVFIDQGRKAGVKLGNRFQVVRRGDGVVNDPTKTEPIENPKFPREVVAEILIVDVREHTAGGLILDATREARIGDRVELRRGH